MKVEIVPAEFHHIKLMLENCREYERAEYEKLTYERSAEHLKQMIRSSAEAWSGFIDDKLACLSIVSRGSILGDSVTVWLHTCAVVDEHPFVFVRHSQIRLAELRKRYHYIYGVIQADNTRSRRWLEWLGFTFRETEFIGGYALKRFSMVS